MTRSSKIHIGLLTAGVLLVGWQFQQHLRQGRLLAAVQTELQNQRQELESRRAALAAVEQRNRELVEAERRAGNHTLISLMRERSAATMSASADAGTPGLGRALADVLDSPEQRDIDQEQQRNYMRANLGRLFKLVDLPVEKQEQYIDAHLEFERRKAERMSALLRGKIAVTDALRERDQDNLELENQRRAVLGPDGYAFLQSIAEGMRTTEAKRLINGIQLGMGGNSLDQEQSDRLQSLIKTELATSTFDDTDLFRPPEEWTQLISEHQEKVLQEATAFLTPAQLETLRTLTALDLAERQKQMMVKRRALGVK